MSKVVLVTGASSGMGHEAAILLAKEGHHVYAGARRVGRMADLADHGITAVELDVTKGEDNERAVELEDKAVLETLPAAFPLDPRLQAHTKHDRPGIAYRHALSDFLADSS